MQQIQEDLAGLSLVPWLSNEQTNVYVLRLDKIHPLISGNKWYKLRYYLDEAKKQHKKVVTFGGAYSNHILATAAACKLYGLECSGIIRGEEPAVYAQTLTDAAAEGMQLHFITREAYKAKQVPEVLQNGQHYFIPEGGYGPLGCMGAATIPFPADLFDGICCATGTGTMMAGLICAASGTTTVTGFSVLKNHQSLKQEITALLPGNNRKPFSINNDFHFGGYARHNAELTGFMNALYTATGIPTDFVYTGKLFFGVKALLTTSFKACRNLLIIHSGGLQGNRSLPKGTLIF